MIRVAESFEVFSSACSYKCRANNTCNHGNKINAMCLEAKYCPRVEATAKKLKVKPAWHTDFNEYCAIHETQYEKLKYSNAWIAEMQERHPDLDILKTIEKAHEFWSRDPKEFAKNGWKTCKSRGSQVLNFKKTYETALTQKWNQVPKTSKGAWLE